MGVRVCGSFVKINKIPKNKGIPTIKCTYDIKNKDYVQILNYKGEKCINDEIESKIKILNGDQKEPIIFQKTFDRLGINVVYFILEEKINDLSYLFNKCSTLKNIEFFSFETIQATKMVAMFQLCNELEYLDLSNFNTSNVIEMRNMFYGCHNLKEIKGINSFNTSNTKNMYAMFEECKQLKFLDLSNFDTSQVINMEYMFESCIKLKEIKGINNFNTVNVTKMTGMFQQCKELEYLDLSNFNTSNVTDMFSMFNGCVKLNVIKGIKKFERASPSKRFGMFGFFGSTLENRNKNNYNGILQNQLNEEKNKNLQLLNELDMKKKIINELMVSRELFLH